MRKSIIGTGVLILVISLMMIISPETCIKVAVIVLGIGGVVNGIYNLLAVRSFVADQTFKRIITIRGLLSIVVGLVAVILPLFLAETIWTIMIYMLAIYLIISAAMEIISTFHLKKEGIPTKMFTIEIISSIILAIILFVIPAALGLNLIRIIGIALLVVSVGLLIWEWRTSSNNTYAKAVVVEDTDAEDTKDSKDSE